MILVALLRARRTLVASAAVLAILTVIVLVSMVTNHIVVQAKDQVPLTDGAFASAALFAALVVASIAATSLNRESATLPLAWTKPVSRRRIALEYFAVDLATIVAVALLAVVALLACVWPIRALLHVSHDPELAELVVRTFGVAFMWYAVVQAATAGLAGRGGLIAGLSWPLFGGLLALSFASLPGLRALALVLNLINPLAWLSTATRVTHGVARTTASSLYPFLPHAVVVVAPWLLAGLALYLATVLWSRREA